MTSSRSLPHRRSGQEILGYAFLSSKNYVAVVFRFLFDTATRRLAARKESRDVAAQVWEKRCVLEFDG
jgi:hypothetical protein